MKAAADDELKVQVAAAERDDLATISPRARSSKTRPTTRESVRKGGNTSLEVQTELLVISRSSVAVTALGERFRQPVIPEEAITSLLTG